MEPDADLPTVIRRAPGGALPDDDHAALPAGTRLGEFEILSVIGRGGFGIVYLAHDSALDRRVAIKEYMPDALAARGADGQVSVRSERHGDTFSAGLRSFVNEAQLLGRFDHPALLKVYRFLQANGTAYMAMPYHRGKTLAQHLKQRTEPPDEPWLRALLAPLLDALEVMHAQNCLHRDIAPDNILLLEDDRPLLLDFGAARHVIAGMTQSLTVILKSGYAPVEQYGEVPGLTQGPWTDLYALGSVLEYAITRKLPPQAVGRYLGDKRQPLAQRAPVGYSAGFLRAIDQALAVLPGDRPQSVAAWRALLEAPSAPAAAPARAVPDATPKPKPARSAAPRTPLQRVALGVASAAALLLVGLGLFVTTRQTSSPEATDGSATPAWAEAATDPPAAAPAQEPAPAPAPATLPTPAPVAKSNEPIAPTPARAPPVAAEPAQPAPAPAPAPATVAVAAPEPRSTAAPSPASPAVATGSATTARAPAAASAREAPRLPRSTPAPQVVQAAPPATPSNTPYASAVPTRERDRQPDSARCADIVQRVSLGEPLSDQDRTTLTRECQR